MTDRVSSIDMSLPIASCVMPLKSGRLKKKLNMSYAGTLAERAWRRCKCDLVSSVKSLGASWNSRVLVAAMTSVKVGLGAFGSTRLSSPKQSPGLTTLTIVFLPSLALTKQLHSPSTTKKTPWLGEPAVTMVSSGACVTILIFRQAALINCTGAPCMSSDLVARNSQMSYFESRELLISRCRSSLPSVAEMDMKSSRESWYTCVGSRATSVARALESASSSPCSPNTSPSSR
mmetsp:Transcript_2594/g.5991  ORF Transcript_2594/g.5991 Transcript_2594/m.5991 type:complete len:232 (+) Transcript_2594:931-1626(+)